MCVIGTTISYYYIIGITISYWNLFILDKIVTFVYRVIMAHINVSKTIFGHNDAGINNICI